MAYTETDSTSEIIDALSSNGYKIAKAYPSQFYSLYKKKFMEIKDDFNPTDKRLLEENLEKRGIKFKKRKDAKRHGYTLYVYNPDWEFEWHKVAIHVHGYYGKNILWFDWQEFVVAASYRNGMFRERVQIQIRGHNLGVR